MKTLFLFLFLPLAAYITAQDSGDQLLLMDDAEDPKRSANLFEKCYI